MKMRLLTFVNCGSFEMRTKRQLNLSCAPLIVVVAAVLTDVDNDATVIFDAMRCDDFVAAALLIKHCEIRAECVCVCQSLAKNSN